MSHFENTNIEASGNAHVHVGINNYQGPAPLNEVEKCLQSLSFENIHLKREKIKHETTGTCAWLLEHHDYGRWASSTAGVLWIRGAPGAGKSTLMNFLVSDMERRTPEHRHHLDTGWHGILYHFFRRDGLDLEKSLEGMTRSLLRQLLQHFPTDIYLLLESFRIKSVGVDLNKEKVKWGTEKLLQLLEVSIQEVLAVTDVRILIDGVDECDGEGAKQFLKMFQNVTKLHTENGTGASVHQLIVCYSCRDDAFINYDSNPSIELQRQNHADIRTYVERVFHGSDLSLSLGDIRLLIDEIDKRANGIFVWAELIVDQMVDDIKQRMPVSQVIAKSSKLPTKLIDLYREIILRMKKEHAFQSLRLLQWVCFWEVPSRQLESMSTKYGIMHTVPTRQSHFSLGSLRAFMNFQAHAENSKSGDGQNQFTDISNDEMMEYQIKLLSGGLARSADGVELVHLSVRDFMLTEGFNILGSTSRGQNIIIGQVHSRLAEACVGYLSMSMRNLSTSTRNAAASVNATSQASSPVKESLKDPVRYALNHAFAHASRADKELHEETFLQTFVGHLQPLLEKEAAWVALLRQELPDVLPNIFGFTENHIPDEAHMHDGKGIFSLLATLYNIPMVLEKVIPEELLSLRKRKEVVYAKTYWKMLNQLLNMAVAEGFLGVVGELARVNDPLLKKMQPWDSEAPLLIAARNNDFDVVHLLVECGYSVDEKLLCALVSRSTTYDMCQYFLAKGAGQDNRLYSPLMAAINASNLELVKLFIRRGANVNAKASWNGGEEGVLLSPLEAAINGKCDFDVVKALLEGGADVGPAHADGGSHIYHYALDCIGQFRTTNGTRERRWADFTTARKEGKDLEDMIESFVRKREDLLPMLRNPPRSTHSNRSRYRDADQPSRKIIQQQDREAAHQPTQQDVGQPGPEDVVQRRRKGPNFNEMLRSCFPARKSTKG
ncbi:hypothetical protein SLS60_007136 [Paraconiothyrium brasiliense]|uniref:Nephrocystin 3-like N-terminal domain-containing protein n=1 Tax=Paraconiothyrium brasiliense TaxID=300254 RepID=A0ABR3R951_9PLEO